MVLIHPYTPVISVKEQCGLIPSSIWEEFHRMFRNPPPIFPSKAPLRAGIVNKTPIQPGKLPADSLLSPYPWRNG